MKGFKIHYRWDCYGKVVSGALCEQRGTLRMSLTWRYVTCKNCLKKKKGKA